jgi:hypothetical protein
MRQRKHRRSRGQIAAALHELIFDGGAITRRLLGARLKVDGKWILKGFGPACARLPDLTIGIASDQAATPVLPAAGK